MCQDQIKIHHGCRNLDAFTITFSHNFQRFRTRLLNYSFFSLTSCFITSCFCTLGLIRYHDQTNLPLLDTGNVIIETSKKSSLFKKNNSACLFLRNHVCVAKFSAWLFKTALSISCSPHYN